MKPFGVVAPDTVEEAVEALGRYGETTSRDDEVI